LFKNDLFFYDRDNLINYSCFGFVFLFGMVPLGHFLMKLDSFRAYELGYAWSIIATGVNGIAAIVYAGKFPERLDTRRFDIWVYTT
jgi:hypothetical protein